jgi:cell division inhibitor SepF
MGLFDKFIGMMGGDEYDDEEDMLDEPVAEGLKSDNHPLASNKSGSGKNSINAKDSQLLDTSTLSGFRNRKNQPSASPTATAAGSPVLSIHTQKQVRVVVVEPKSFDESQNIAEHLKSHRTVVLNLEKTDSVLAQRIVDFVSGTTYALNGNMQKVGKAIFLFVPNNVDISGDLSFRISETGLTWPGFTN